MLSAAPPSSWVVAPAALLVKLLVELLIRLLVKLLVGLFVKLLTRLLVKLLVELLTGLLVKLPVSSRAAPINCFQYAPQISRRDSPTLIKVIVAELRVCLLCRASLDGLLQRYPPRPGRLRRRPSRRPGPCPPPRAGRPAPGIQATTRLPANFRVKFIRKNFEP